MNRDDAHWRIPRDWRVLLPLSFAPAMVGILIATILPVVARAREGDVTIFPSAIAGALLGLGLLFLAKLPLYRQGRFITFGPGALPKWNRLLYAVAYVFLGLSAGVLLVLLAALR